MTSMADAVHRRWYRVTPGRLLAILLAVEGFLWLSERFHWFAFGQQKGCAVLIAMGTVVVFMPVIFLWSCFTLVFQWRFRFTIRFLLALTVAVAVPCSCLRWMATDLRKARGQMKAVEVIEKAGGRVTYDFQCDRLDPGAQPPQPPWLRKLLGDDFFLNVTEVRAGESGFDDAGLERLEELLQLHVLDLRDTKVTSAGLEELTGLSQLQRLNLVSTQVTDTGLEHLKALTQVQYLFLDGAEVTAQGVKKLQKALPHCQVVWDPRPTRTPLGRTLRFVLGEAGAAQTANDLART